MKFLIYDGTTQRTCLRLMGRKMLVALMMEGKFSGEAFIRRTPTTTCSPLWHENSSRKVVSVILPMLCGKNWVKNRQSISHQRLPPRQSGNGNGVRNS